MQASSDTQALEEGCGQSDASILRYTGTDGARVFEAARTVRPPTLCVLPSTEHRSIPC